MLWHNIPEPMNVILKPTLFFTDPLKPNFFLKSILGGMLITSSMNGLDQNIMQMNLSCRSLSEAKKNMITLAFVMVAVNFVFMSLGSLVKEYYQLHSIPLPLLPEGGIAYDQTLPRIALTALGRAPAMIFIIGLAAATFSSAGTILPAIASSIEIDLFPQSLQKKIPVRVIHALAAVLILFLIIAIYETQARSLIDLVLRCSGYTYGPLIGLFGIGIFTQIKLNHKMVPLFCAVAIILTALLDMNSAKFFNGYRLGVELIAVNAIIFVVSALSFGRTQRV